MRVFAALLCFVVALCLFGYSIPSWVQAEQKISRLGDEQVKAFSRELSVPNHEKELELAIKQAEIDKSEGKRVNHQAVTLAQNVVDSDRFAAGLNPSFEELSGRIDVVRHEEHFFQAYLVVAFGFLIAGLVLASRRKKATDTNLT
ncbi:MAG: hypothetical protein ABSC77_01845 [Terracidiphilus sp.]|jgi:hypothetical protein